VYPGLPFRLTVAKEDAYNQTVTSDSSSFVQLQVVLFAGGQRADNSITVSGESLFKLRGGEASVAISVQPLFKEDVDSAPRQWRLTREVSLFASGIDERSTSLLLSQVAPVTFATGNAVCPPGYILVLDSLAGSAAGVKGGCAYCQAGTYSLNPLASGSTNQTRPACLNCPPASTCAGGGKVQLGPGEWIVAENGTYKLVKCPAGHQLIDSINGVFSHDFQVCPLGRVETRGKQRVSGVS
jgi:hypothetical protein